MKVLSYIVGVILLLTPSLTEAGKRKIRTSKLLHRPLIYSGKCGNSQQFATGRHYSYNYEAKVIQDLGYGYVSGFKIQCSSVKFMVVSLCSARMLINGCSYSQITQQQNKSLLFTPDDNSKLPLYLERYPTYFHFNRGEVEEVFLNRNEHPEIRNFKKGMISTFSVNIQTTSRSAVKKYETNGNSYFGKVNSTMTYQYINQSLSSVTRVTPNLRHSSRLIASTPMSRKENVLATFLNDQIQKLADVKIEGTTSSQNCSYQLFRGKGIVDATCIEYYSLPFLQQFNTKVTQRFTLVDHAGLRRRGRINNAERKRIVRDYRNSSLTLDTTWSNPENDIDTTFDPVEALFSISKDVTPFSDLVQWMVDKSAVEINAVWNQVVQGSNENDFTQLTETWIQLLGDCMDTKWCSNKNTCSENRGCVESFHITFSSTYWRTEVESIRDLLRDVLTQVANPTPDLVMDAKHVSTASLSPSNILVLGKVLNHYVTSSAPPISDSLVVGVSEYLKNIVDDQCSKVKHTTESEKIAVNTMQGISFLQRSFTNVTRLIPCLRSTSSPIAMATLQLINDNDVIANDNEIRQHLLEILIDGKLKTDVRVSSFLILVRNQPTDSEIDVIMDITQSNGGDKGLKFYVNEFLRNQLEMHNTKYGSLSNRTVSTLMKFESMSNNAEGIGEAKKYDFSFPISLPSFGKNSLQSFIKLEIYFSGNNPIPKLVEIAVKTELNNQNITILHIKIDSNKLNHILRATLGDEGLLPSRGFNFESFMKTPLKEWIKTPEFKEILLPLTSVKNLHKMADQFETAKNILKMQQQFPVEVELFGENINLHTVMEYLSLKQINFAKLIEFMEMLQNGITLDLSKIGMPLYYQNRYATSLGLPITTTISLMHHWKPSLQLNIDWKSMRFMNNGITAFKVKPRLKLAADIHSKFKLLNSPPCGSKMNTKFEMNQGVSLTFNKTDNSIGFSAQSYETTENDFLFKMETSQSFQTLPNNVEEMNWLCSGTHYWATREPNYVCTARMQIPVHQNLNQRFSSVLKWGTMDSIDGNGVKRIGEEIQWKNELGTANNPHQIYSTSASVMYIPELSMLRAKWPKYLFEGQDLPGNNYYMDLMYKPNTDKQGNLESISASFNASRGTFRMFTSIINVVKTNLTDRDHLIQGMAGDDTTGYDLIMDFAVLDSSQRFVAHISNETIPGEFNFIGQLFSLDLTPHLSKWVVKATRRNIQSSDKISTTTSVVFTNFTEDFSHSNILNASMHLVSSRDSNGRQDKLLRFEYIVGSKVEFIDMRTKTYTSNETGEFGWLSSYTVNSEYYNPMQLQAEARLINDTIMMKTYLTHDNIDALPYDGFSHEIPYMNTTAPNIYVYGLENELKFGSRGYSNIRLYMNEPSTEKQQVLINIGSYEDCNFCINADINTLKLDGHYSLVFLPGMFVSNLTTTVSKSFLKLFGIELNPEAEDISQIDLCLKSDLSSDAFNVVLTHMFAGSIFVLNTHGEYANEVNISTIPNIHDKITFEISADGTEQLSMNIKKSIDFKSTHNSNGHLRAAEDSFEMKVPAMFQYYEKESVHLQNGHDDNRLDQVNIQRNANYSFMLLDFFTKLSSGNVTLNRKLPQIDQISSQHVEDSSGTLDLNILPLSEFDRMSRNWGMRGSMEFRSRDILEGMLLSVCGSNTNCLERSHKLIQTLGQSNQEDNDIIDVLNFAQNHFSNIFSALNDFNEIMEQEFDPWLMDGLFEQNMEIIEGKLIPNVFDYKWLQISSILPQLEEIFKSFNEYLEKYEALYPEFEIDISIKNRMLSLLKVMSELDLNKLLGKVDLVHMKRSDFIQIYESVERPINKEIMSTTGLEPVSSVAFIYPNKGQFITSNEHYHVFPPVPPNGCVWLTFTSKYKGLGTIVMDRDSSTTHLAGETMVQYRNGSMFTLNNENQLIAQEFPFKLGDLLCYKLLDNVIECKSPVTNYKASYDFEEGIATLYADMRGPIKYTMNGIGGEPGDVKVPKYLLPDGSVADSEAEFLNAYELSHDPSCIYSHENVTASRIPTSNGLELCTVALKPYQEHLSNRSYDSYLSACSESCVSIEQTCKYTSMVVEMLRNRGIGTWNQLYCLKCGSIQPISTTVNRINFVIAVSLSNDMLEISPHTFISELIDELAESMTNKDVSHDYTLMTFGGTDILYQPLVHTINNKVTSTDKHRILEAISQLQFDGPSNTDSVDGDALNLISRNFYSSHVGAKQIVLLVTPRVHHMDTSMLASIEKLISRMTSLYIISSKTSHCEDAEGLKCFHMSQESLLTKAILNDGESFMGKHLECSCKELDSFTGEIASTCVAVK